MVRAKQGTPIFMLVGNKCDKSFEREVSKEEGAVLAQQFGCGFMEASAKTAQNVEHIFINIVRSLRAPRVIVGQGTLNAPTKTGLKSKCVIM